MTELKLPLADEAATIDLARRIAANIDTGLVFYLHGDLGAGKTTFARALLIALGVGERVKSPTYSLVESYEVDGRSAWHLDLYRIADAGELEWLGLDALAEPDAIVLVEWPERGRGALPLPDITIDLGHADGGRTAVLKAVTVVGQRLLDAFVEAK
jgi:tRNA threonylcarbamoyladenosine biosynthesis protein TsaE